MKSANINKTPDNSPCWSVLLLPVLPAVPVLGGMALGLLRMSATKNDVYRAGWWAGGGRGGDGDVDGGLTRTGPGIWREDVGRDDGGPDGGSDVVGFGGDANAAMLRARKSSALKSLFGSGFATFIAIGELSFSLSDSVDSFSFGMAWSFRAG